MRKNNKVIITIYIFNRQKNNFLLKIKKRFISKSLINVLSLKNNPIKLLNKEKITFITLFGIFE